MRLVLSFWMAALTRPARMVLIHSCAVSFLVLWYVIAWKPLADIAPHMGIALDKGIWSAYGSSPLKSGFAASLLLRYM